MGSKPSKKLRFCIDYRDMNKVTRKDAYPLPNMDRILDGSRIACYISTIDLSEAYFHVPLNPDSRPLTAFAVPGRGQFQFLRMPFGSTNAPAKFQRLMDIVITAKWEPNMFA